MTKLESRVFDMLGPWNFKSLDRLLSIRRFFLRQDTAAASQALRIEADCLEMA